MTSALFRYVEQLQGQTPWGDFLDAGTGVNSALWSTALPVRSWAGVSGAAGHMAQVKSRLSEVSSTDHRLLLGNWTDPRLLAGEGFDTVLADYLVGAIEGFSPYFQSEIFRRLRPLARGRLYVIGLDPYVVGTATSDADRVVRAIGRLRDAILLLADETPYREYPAEWTARALAGSGFEVISARRFPNRYHEVWVHGQLDMAIRRLSKVDPSLAQPLAAKVQDLRHEACDVCRRDGGLRSGFDYVIEARVAGLEDRGAKSRRRRDLFLGQ